MGKRRIVIYNKHLVKLRLFYGKIGAGMLQFCGKRYGVATGNSVEILTKIVGEIHRDLPGFFWVEPAKTVDAHQCIVDEMRPHLQHHDAGALVGDFPLLPGNFLLLFDNFQLVEAVLFDLIGQYEAVHGQCGAYVADIDEWEDVDEQMHDQRNHNRQYGDEKGEKHLAGKPFPALYRSRQIEKPDHDQRQQKEWVQGAAVILVFRRDIEKTLYKRGAGIRDQQDGPRAKHGVKKSAGAYVFTTAVKQKNRQHGQRQRKQQGFQKQQEIKYLPRDNKKLEELFENAGQAAKHKNEKISHEKTLAPVVDPGNNGGKPQPHCT